MRVAATDVKPGDRVRGIGLVVDEVTPENDFWTRIEGSYSLRNSADAVADGAPEFSEAVASVVLPNEHFVNVVRSDENFRADRVAAVQTALDAYAVSEEDDATETLVKELTRIARMPRGSYADYSAVGHYVAAVMSGEETAEQILDAIDKPGATAFKYTEEMRERDIQGL